MPIKQKTQQRGRMKEPSTSKTASTENQGRFIAHPTSDRLSDRLIHKAPGPQAVIKFPPQPPPKNKNQQKSSQTLKANTSINEKNVPPRKQLAQGKSKQL